MEKKDEITLIDAFKDFKEEKNIDRPVMMGVLKDVFLTQIAKTYGSTWTRETARSTRTST